MVLVRIVTSPDLPCTFTGDGHSPVAVWVSVYLQVVQGGQEGWLLTPRSACLRITAAVGVHVGNLGRN